MTENARAHRALARLTALDLEQVSGGARLGAPLESTTMTHVSTLSEHGEDTEDDIDCDATL